MHYTYIIENEMFEYANSHPNALHIKNIRYKRIFFYLNILSFNLIIYIYIKLD